MLHLLGSKSAIQLNRICKVKGEIYLIAEKLRPYAEKSNSETFEKQFVIQIKESKPKKINRKTVFYTSESFNPDDAYLMYTDTSGKISCLEKIKTEEDAYGSITFNLLGMLRESGIAYELPSSTRISDLDKIVMRTSLQFDYFGYRTYLSEGGAAHDGIGDGYTYHLWDGYLKIDETAINKITIRDYFVSPIKDATDDFLEEYEDNGEKTTKERFADTLKCICEGNEFAIATELASVQVCRHYDSKIEIAIGDKIFRCPIHKKDSKHTIEHRNETEWLALMKKMSEYYADLIMRIIDSKSEENVMSIIDELGAKEVKTY